MIRYIKLFEDDSDLDEKTKQLIISITKGKNLIDKRLSNSDYNILKTWAKTKPKVTGLIYRVIRVNLEEFYNRHIYDAHNQNGLQKDELIFIKQFESWTKDRKRVYSYGNPKEGQEAILLIMDASKIKCVDISAYSVYPEEKEVRNLEDMKVKINKADYGKVGWELSVEEI